MAPANPALAELARVFGISTEFWDWKGRHTQVSDESIIAILKAMSVDASDPEKVDEAVRELDERPWRRSLPPVVVVREGAIGHVNVHVVDGEPADLVIRLEEGGTRTDLVQLENWTPAKQIDDVWMGEATFQLPTDLPLGYHRLVLTSSDREVESTLIVTPDFLGLPTALSRRCVWGYATQLYSVRSSGSWGVGDIVDLADLATWSATQQYAGYVLINPLHAAQSSAPLEPSPYLPSTRRYMNPLYVRPEAIEEYATLDDETRERIELLRRSVVDDPASMQKIRRDEAMTAKMQALRLIFDAGRRPARQMLFNAYRRTEGRALLDFATWWVASQTFGNDWREWDEPYQRPTSPEMAAFRAEHADEIAFAEWLQWVANDQLSATQRKALDAGMPVGIVVDLAVGVNRAGAETWMMPDLFAKGVSVGAPPDAYNQIGQDWGQPPWRPDRLADLAYAPFRAMVRNAVQHAGGVRIDHILGMFRLWWVPQGHSPADGAYIRYDHEAMIGIIALEAKRANAVVIGEDLGTVEPWVRTYLTSRGILGTSVAWFESAPEGGPRDPETWRELAMASVTTHDLPPTAGYLALDHVRLRSELGLMTESLAEELAKAEDDQRTVLDYLREHGYLDENPAVDPDNPQLPDSEVEAQMLGLYRYLTATASRVLNVALVDAVGDRRTQNQPGTIDEYPNWRVPLSNPAGEPILLEDVYEAEAPMRLAAVMNGFTLAPEPWRG